MSWASVWMQASDANGCVLFDLPILLCSHNKCARARPVDCSSIPPRFSMTGPNIHNPARTGQAIRPIAAHPDTLTRDRELRHPFQEVPSHPRSKYCSFASLLPRQSCLPLPKGKKGPSQIKSSESPAKQNSMAMVQIQTDVLAVRFRRPILCVLQTAQAALRAGSLCRSRQLEPACAKSR